MPEQTEELPQYQTPYPGLKPCGNCGEGTVISTEQRGGFYWLECLGCGRRGTIEDNTFLAMIGWNAEQTSWRKWR